MVLSKTRFDDKSVTENTRQVIPVFSSMDPTGPRLQQLAAHWNSLLVDRFGALGGFVLEVFCGGAAGTQVASLRS